MPWKSISSTTQLVREERDEEKKGKYIKTQTASFCAHPHSLVAQQGWFGPDSIMGDMSVNSCHIGAISHSHRLWDLR